MDDPERSARALNVSLLYPRKQHIYYKRQRKSKKHCAVGAAKQHGKTIKPVTPTPPEIENDPPSQNEPQCEGNSNPLSTQNDHQNEGPSSSDKGPSGGPIDKSVLTSFNDHIAYAIWNQTKVFDHYISYFYKYAYAIYNCG
ncbi:hypothetical protein LguiA_028937 [Lonicera macranthoides]